jgi:hypothetical protein
MSPAPPKYDTHLPVTAVALTVATVRLLIVEAWSEGEEADHRLVPVLALQSSVTSDYTRSRQDGRVPPRSAGAARLEAAGRHLEDTRTELDPIVLDSDYGLVAARLAFDGCNVAWRAVSSPWDSAEDEDRLADMIADLKAEAQAKVDQELVLAGRKAAEKDGGD